MQREDILKIIRETGIVRNDRLNLSCSAAFKIAAEYGIKLCEISEICNQENIRISSCQLGCFK